MFVSNTSTMILLAKAGILRLFLEDVSRIIIPKVVYDEMKGKESFEVIFIDKEIENGRIKVMDINKVHYDNILKQFKLNEGEAAAYALFKNEKGKALLTDDGELIKLCKIENIPFMTAMSIVVGLFKRKKVTEKDAMEALKKIYGYGRYSEEIYDYFKSEVK